MNKNYVHPETELHLRAKIQAESELEAFYIKSESKKNLVRAMVSFQKQNQELRSRIAEYEKYSKELADRYENLSRRKIVLDDAFEKVTFALHLLAKG